MKESPNTSPAKTEGQNLAITGKIINRINADDITHGVFDKNIAENINIDLTMKLMQQDIQNIESKQTHVKKDEENRRRKYEENKNLDKSKNRRYKTKK